MFIITQEEQIENRKLQREIENEVRAEALEGFYSLNKATHVLANHGCTLDQCLEDGFVRIINLADGSKYISKLELFEYLGY